MVNQFNYGFFLSIIDLHTQDLKTKQQLNIVKNAAKNTVFRESCFMVIVSFSPIFSRNLRTI